MANNRGRIRWSHFPLYTVDWSEHDKSCCSFNSSAARSRSLIFHILFVSSIKMCVCVCVDPHPPERYGSAYKYSEHKRAMKTELSFIHSFPSEIVCQIYRLRPPFFPLKGSLQLDKKRSPIPMISFRVKPAPILLLFPFFFILENWCGPPYGNIIMIFLDGLLFSKSQRKEGGQG